MKPAVFDYVRAESLEEALEVLHEEGADARILAGGQTLIPMLNMRMARPSLVVDIMRISGLDRIDIVDSGIRIGATVRQRALEQDRELSIRQPLLAAALPWIGTPKPAAAVRCAARWRTPIPAANCRWF